MTRDDTEIVSAVRAVLARRVGRERFGLWFGASTRLTWAEGVMTVAAPNRIFRDWLRSNFQAPLEDACRETGGAVPALRFVVDASLPEPLPAMAPQGERKGREVGEGGKGEGGKGSGAEPAGKAGDQGPLGGLGRYPGSNGRTGDNGQGGGNGSGSQTAHPRQRGKSAAERRFASFETFVTGPSNRIARAAAEMAVQPLGQFSPLTIHGSTSVGKTHLLQAVWTAARRMHSKANAVFLSAEQFTSYFVEAVRGSGLPSFRRKYRGVDLLILDDLQFFCGKRSTQVELRYTVDTVLRRGGQIVFSSDRPPAELTDLGPELLSRLASGMVCAIELPEHATRLGIVAHLAGRLEMSVPNDVRQFVAARLASHARELAGALCRLQAASKAYQRPIDLALAEEVLAEMIRQGSRVVRLADIDRAVCEVFGLESATLKSARKGKAVSHPRMLAMWLARKHTRAAFSEIGQFFGRRSHSTVIAAQKRVDVWLAGQEPLQTDAGQCTVEEAICRIERHLLAG